jgi:hypothetical protein
MTADHWFMLALVVAQLIAPSLAELIKHLITQPKPTPEPSQPKTVRQKMSGWLVSFLQSPWYIPLFTILFEIYLLQRDLRSAAPITRSVVYSISTEVGTILYSLLNASFLMTSQTISRHSDQLLQLAKDQLRQAEATAVVSNTVSAVVKLVSAQTDATDAKIKEVVTQIQLDKSKPGLPGKLVSTIKKLFKS